MRKSRFTESQTVGILKDGESGLPLVELVRKHGITRTTCFRWKAKYGRSSAPSLPSAIADWTAWEFPFAGSIFGFAGIRVMPHTNDGFWFDAACDGVALRFIRGLWSGCAFETGGSAFGGSKSDP